MLKTCLPSLRAPSRLLSLEHARKRVLCGGLFQEENIEKRLLLVLEIAKRDLEAARLQVHLGATLPAKGRGCTYSPRHDP